MPDASDFTLLHEGSIALLTPETDAAREWAVEHLPHDGMKWGSAFVIEHRYVNDIIQGLTADGLTLS